jgi:hypothetical protein
LVPLGAVLGIAPIKPGDHRVDGVLGAIRVGGSTRRDLMRND